MSVEHATSLLDELRRRFDVVETPVVVGGVPTTMRHPRSPDALIDEAEFERDERLPYWADLWPSGRVLADHVAGLSGDGRSFLELGCGSGLVAVAAVRAGFDAMATDYDADALAFTRANVMLLCGREIPVRELDWRSVPRDIGRFDCVVGADVLYERSHADLVARAFDLLLSARGSGIVADPGRIAVHAFLERCRTLALRVETIDRVAFEDGAQRQTISLFRIAR